MATLKMINFYQASKQMMSTFVKERLKMANRKVAKYYSINFEALKINLVALKKVNERKENSFTMES